MVEVFVTRPSPQFLLHWTNLQFALITLPATYTADTESCSLLKNTLQEILPNFCELSDNVAPNSTNAAEHKAKEAVWSN